MELTPTLQWIHRIYVTVFRELSNLLQVTFQNGRFIVAMLALLTRKSSIISPDTSLLKNILHAVCKLLCAKFCVVTKNLSYFLSSAANDLRQIQLYGGPWTSTSWDNWGGGAASENRDFFFGLQFGLKIRGERTPSLDAANQIKRQVVSYKRL